MTKEQSFKAELCYNQVYYHIGDMYHVYSIYHIYFHTIKNFIYASHYENFLFNHDQVYQKQK